MILNYKDYAPQNAESANGSDSGPVVSGSPVFFLHGLLGNAENWASTARELSACGFRCITVDQRNHGSSPHSSEMSYPLMAADLIRLADSLGIGGFSIIGHSMGGKTAMETALSYPDRVRSLLVADIAPVEYEPVYKDYINALKKIRLDGLRSRSDANRVLEEHIPDRNLRMFFLTNLRKVEDGHYQWRINIEGIISNYSNIWHSIEAGRRYKGPVVFIKGSESDFIKPEHGAVITGLFPYCRLETIEGSGHWVHTEKPQVFRRICREFLENSRAF